MTATAWQADSRGARRRIPPGVVAATVAGNVIEFYDFLCFSFFAVYIAKAFFPGADDFSNLLKTLAVFWSGFLLRPVGGVVIGAFADRAGRRPAMMLTIVLITIGTLGLAAIPSYQSIGMAAPILLVACRFIQGFALGGEVGPASVYLIEAAPPGSRGFYASWQIASQGIAVAVAGALGAYLATVLSPAQLTDWGWRVPFVLCFALIPVALYLRGQMPETLHSEGAPAEWKAETRAAPEASANNAKYITLGTIMIVGGTVSTYVGNYMATYAITTLKLPAALSLSATLVNGVAIFVFGLLGGWLGDRYGRKPVAIWPKVVLAIIIWPLFIWLSSAPSAVSLWVTTLLIGGLNAMASGIGIAILPELLPRRIRATGFAISYAVGVSLFGGSTQLTVAWLIGATGHPAAPAWYVIATSIVALGALLALPETLGRQID